MYRMRNIAGFTLIEMMITVSIAAIGMAIAFPSFTGVLRSNKVATGTNELIASFNLARTEAIRSNRGSGVCPSTTGAACNGSDWSVGILIFADNDGNRKWSAGDSAIRYFDARPGLVVEAEPNAGGPGGGGATTVSEVSFDSRGKVASAVDIVLKPTDCKKDSNLQRRIHVSRIGQTRTSKEVCE
ncbi:MAG: GspH/FimT family pseudopilin [Stenotrophomonas sp.]